MPWIQAGASLLGGLFGSDAASDAAAGQAQATREANELQRYIYDNNVKLNQPAIDAGNLGRNKLLQLLGLGGGAGTPAGPSKEQLRSQLQASFTRPGQMVQTGYGDTWDGRYTQGAPVLDEVGLTAAVDARYQPGTPAGPMGEDYGSLLKNFTGADLANEPGYQFGLNEGQKAIDRRAASGGGYFSGAALKAAQRFGQDYAGTKFGEAFNRDAANKTNTFNRLSSLTGGAQTAANQVGSMGQGYANQVGNNLTANATAQGAAGIAGANAWQDAINGGVNAFTRSNAQNSIYRNLTGGRDTMGFGGEY